MTWTSKVWGHERVNFRSPRGDRVRADRDRGPWSKEYELFLKNCLRPAASQATEHSRFGKVVGGWWCRVPLERSTRPNMPVKTSRGVSYLQIVSPKGTVHSLHFQVPAPHSLIHELLRRYPDPSLALSTRLANHRKRLGWSQERAAEHFGISQNYYFKIESGRRAPGSALREQMEAWCPPRLDAGESHGEEEQGKLRQSPVA